MSKKVWCKIENTHLKGYIIGKHPKRVRCPDCKKRFLVFIRECDDPGCLHLYMPKHKRLL